MNTYTKSGSFGSIFTQANPNTAYGSIFQNNMDDTSFNGRNASLTKTITIPRQAFSGYQEHVAENLETACKVSLYYFYSGTVILISISCAA